MRLPSAATKFAVLALLLCVVGPSAAHAQQTAAIGPSLSLPDAIELARSNNPSYLQTLRDVAPAGMRVRSAYAAFIPQISTSLDASFREGRPQFFGGTAFGATSDVVSSGYSLDASLQLNSSTFMGPRTARANLDAAEATANAARQTLAQQVTQRYMAVLQQIAQSELQDTLLSSAQIQLQLAEARAAAGAGTVLDVQRARVQVGQAEVQRLRARNSAEVEKLRLFQLMGINQPDDVQLVSDFPTVRLEQSLDQLLELARTQNPDLVASRSRERASSASLMSARGQYAPSLSLRAGVGGFTQQYTDESFVVGQALSGKQSGCFNEARIRDIVGMPNDPAACSAIALTPEERSAALNGNSAFPFEFDRQPYTLSAVVSLPLFNGLNREVQVQEAAAQRDNARYAVRALELQLVADVTGAYRTLATDIQAIEIQRVAAETARQALELARERYRVGASSFVEVTQAQSDYATAQTNLIDAIYTYHNSFAALEAAVGRPLR
ncbi:MAG TPA: TolC family protein [Gemmatimonadales bacterium]|nr:TolC family protein [Gemmatimonadales bacterium]